MLLVFVCLCFGISVPAAAAGVYNNYTYDYYTHQASLEPQAYEPDEVITAEQIGVENLNEPQDLFAGPDGRFYLADSGNNRVLIMGSDWRLLKSVDAFADENGATALKNPGGVYVNKSGELFVADTGNQRIVVFTKDGAYLRQYGKPESPLIDSNFLYAPTKVSATESGKMFVVSENEIKGILQIQKDGRFSGYFGAVQTVPNLAETFWRWIATEEQLSWMSQVVPTNYSNLDLDESGFVYTTVMAVDKSSSYDTSLFVRRLNPMGNDVLERNSWLPIVGDHQTTAGNLSRLTDICVVGNGIYSVLGQEFCRVYTYDYNGNFLFAFGGEGDALGQLKVPVALTVLPERRYAVLDKKLGQIVCYKPTVYGRLLLEATEAFYNREYTVSEEKFSEALQYSSKSDIVYVGIGRAALRNKEYSKAMQAFQLGNNQGLYSEAYLYHRKELGKQIFPWLLGGLVLVLSAAVLLRKKLRRRATVPAADAPSTLSGNLRYASHVMFHPFKGFWGLKRERQHTSAAAAVFVALMTLVSLLTPQYTSYLFNTGDPRYVSALLQIAKVLLPFLVWCIGNWCVTTLMNGEGTFGQIAVTTAYSLVPLILTQSVLIVMSHFLTYNEQTVYTLIVWLGWIWFGFLLISGIMTIHQFSLAKTVVTMILACVAAIILLILSLALMDLISKLIGFVSVLLREWPLW